MNAIAAIPSLIPENAPFSSEQRAWLNGFFAAYLGVDSDAAAAVKGEHVCRVLDVCTSDAGLPSGTATRSYGCLFKTTSTTIGAIIAWGTLSTGDALDLIVGVRVQLPRVSGRRAGELGPDQLHGEVFPLRICVSHLHWHQVGEPAPELNGAVR